MEALLAA